MKQLWRGCRRSLIGAILVILAAPAVAEDSQADLRAALGTASVALPGALHQPAALKEFYDARDFRPIWGGAGCEERLRSLRAVIARASDHGLRPDDYHAGALDGLPGCDWRSELLATDAWLAYADDLYGGRIDPAAVEPDWNLPRPRLDAAAALRNALAAGALAASLNSLAPQDAEYRALQDALARFRDYARRGGWSGVEPGPTLRVGDAGPRVDQLRQRLALSGLIEIGTFEPADAFDPALEEAVRAFQRRANLEPDGVVGALTLAQLNRRASDRIDQLRANLERRRWLRVAPGERHVRVNIADFRLEAWGSDGPESVHRVIVGQLYRPTPSFAGSIERIVFWPWWEVPRRLAVQDKLPLFRRDPDAFIRSGYELLDATGRPVAPEGVDWNALSRANFPYRLRQRPGPANALGEVKILFPNRHDVYLHDTPTHDLFARTRRSFSSGCIRVEGALEMAEWLLQETPGWGGARMQTALSKVEEQGVRLAQPVPVYLVYLTVASADDGSVRFLDDLYGRDAALVNALDAVPTSQMAEQAGLKARP